MRRFRALLFGAITLLLLASCGSDRTGDASLEQAERAEVPKTWSSGKSVSTAPVVFPQAEQNTDDRAEIIRGTGSFVNAPSRAGNAIKAPVTTSGEGIALNFVNAEVRDVLSALLGQTLGFNYLIDPKVKGTITLKSAQPIAREAVLPTLEETLRVNSLALINKEDIFHITALSDAPKEPGVVRAITPGRKQPDGFSVRVVPLKYSSAQAMEKVLKPLFPGGGIVKTDPERNLLFLSGTQTEIEAILDAVDIFDVDWLKAMTYGIFTPDYVSAKTLVGELQYVFKNKNSPIAGLVDMFAIPRLNAVLVMSKQPGYVEQAKVWMERLDRPTEGPARRIYLYHVQHSRAADLASSIGSLWGQGGGVANDFADYDRSGDRGGFSIGNEDDATGSVREANVRSEPVSTGATTVAAGEMRISADEKNNALLIMATTSEYEQVLRVIHELDVAPDQVLIEAAIAEITLTDDLRFGVQWFFREDSDYEVTLSEAASGAVASVFPGFSYTYFVDDIEVALNALSSLTEVKVISSPKLMVVNNQTAHLQVGDQVPVATQSAVSITDPDAPIVNNIQFRDTGVILEVTPRINKSGSVLLDVIQEVSDVAETVTSGIDSPTIQQRKIASTVSIQDGETVALGGLIRDNDTESDGGVPFFKDIPVLGHAFKSTDKSSRRTELLVFITPRIVRSVDDAREITSYLRNKLHDVNILAAETNANTLETVAE